MCQLNIKTSVAVRTSSARQRTWLEDCWQVPVQLTDVFAVHPTGWLSSCSLTPVGSGYSISHPPTTAQCFMLSYNDQIVRNSDTYMYSTVQIFQCVDWSHNKVLWGIICRMLNHYLSRLDTRCQTNSNTAHWQQNWLVAPSQRELTNVLEFFVVD